MSLDVARTRVENNRYYKLNLKGLLLTKSDIDTLFVECSKLKTIKILDLSNNNIDGIPDSIGKLKSLCDLNLHNNKLTELPNNITKLKKLDTLDLSNNEITEISNNIGKMHSLYNLNIDNNEITEIPYSIAKLKRLLTLSLSNNKITEIPYSIAKFKKLHTLSLSNNEITEIPDSIGKLIDLNYLYLHNNKITELPGNITNLKKLRTLHLTNNEISEIPDSIGELTLLNDLYLSDNNFIEIPNNILKLKNICRLNLSNNQITEIPDSIVQLRTLNTLNLSKNNITQIPYNISELTNLKVLDISHNRIIDVPASIGSLTSLVELNLISNPLSDETIAFLSNRLGSIFLFNMGAYNNTDWRVIFNQLDICNKNEIIKTKIKNNLELQSFISSVGSTVLYKNSRNIALQTLNNLLLQIDDQENQEEAEATIAEMIGATGDCSTPVNELLLTKYIGSLKQKNLEIPDGLEEKIAVSNFIKQNFTLLHLKRNEAIEQSNGLLNSIFLKNAHAYEENKLKIKSDYNISSSTTYIQFAFEQVTGKTATEFAKYICETGNNGSALIKNGLHILDHEKIKSIVEKYNLEGLALDNFLVEIIDDAFKEISVLLEKYEYDYEKDSLKLFGDDKKANTVKVNIQKLSKISNKSEVEHNTKLIEQYIIKITDILKSNT